MKTLRSSVNLRRLGQVGVDACLLALAYYLSYVLRFDSGIPARYQELLEQTIVFAVLMKLTVFALFGLYTKLWRFVDQRDFESVVKAVVVSSFVLIAALFLLSLSRADPPRGVIALVAWLMGWIGGVVGDIGTGLQNQAVANIGVFSHMLLPTDGLWRGAMYAMEPDAFLASLKAAGTIARANPFVAVDPPPTQFLAWVVVWFALMLALSIWSFRTREI